MKRIDTSHYIVYVIHIISFVCLTAQYEALNSIEANFAFLLVFFLTFNLNLS